VTPAQAFAALVYLVAADNLIHERPEWIRGIATEWARVACRLRGIE